MSSSILNELKNCIINGDTDKIEEIVRKALNQGFKPEEIINKGIEAMNIVGEMFEKGEVFIPEVMIAAEVFKKMFETVKPYLKTEVKGKGRVVIGTVEGDIHSIGKDLVATMLQIAGFEVIDLGVDVSTEKFIEAIEKYKPDVLGMSALMTTTMINQRKVIEELKKRGLRNKVKVIVGGAPVTEEWAREIGADAYAKDAFEAVRIVERLIKER